MLDITDKKYFSYQITERFFFAMDRILGSRSAGKITAQAFGKTVGITSNNLNRIRNNPGEHFVTIEAIGRLCNNYRISAYWLLTGQGDLYSNDELATAYITLSNQVQEIQKSLHEIEVIVPKLKGLLKK